MSERPGKQKLEELVAKVASFQGWFDVLVTADTIRSISDAYKAMEAENERLAREALSSDGQAHEAQERALKAEAENERLRRLIVDREYMLHAYRNMLGPKGREVADMWAKKSVQRAHFEWGPKAQDMSGEDRAAFILELENTLWTPVDNIDAPEGDLLHEG